MGLEKRRYVRWRTFLHRKLGQGRLYPCKFLISTTKSRMGVAGFITERAGTTSPVSVIVARLVIANVPFLGRVGGQLLGQVSRGQKLQ
jgi:hypothetical protein